MGRSENVDIGDICDFCEDRDCMNCSFGNPCLDCEDYDREKQDCTSKGACGEKGVRAWILYQQ